MGGRGEEIAIAAKLQLELEWKKALKKTLDACELLTQHLTIHIYIDC
jgi:hypothetical protein